MQSYLTLGERVWAPHPTHLWAQALVHDASLQSNGVVYYVQYVADGEISGQSFSRTQLGRISDLPVHELGGLQRDVLATRHFCGAELQFPCSDCAIDYAASIWQHLQEINVDLEEKYDFSIYVVPNANDVHRSAFNKHRLQPQWQEML